MGALENALYAQAQQRALRFCMVTTFYPPYSFGGDAVYVQQLANALAARGHHVEIIHCLDSYHFLARHATLRESYDHPNVIVHRLKSAWGALSPLATQQTGFPLFKYKQIEKILARGFDVIHYHNISLVGGPKILELGAPSTAFDNERSSGHGAVRLYTPHEYWLVCPMNVLFRYDGVACEEKKCLRCTLAYGRPPQWWRYTDMLAVAVRQIDMFLYPSSFSLQKHRELGLDTPATVLPLFHTPSTVTADIPPLETTQPYFLYVGRLEPLKGVHTLIPFFREYGRARLVIVGEGSQANELVHMAGASPNVEFLGWLDHSQLAPLYRNATALLVPSLCFENNPLVILEAFVQQTPVIVRDIGALPDLVCDTGGGKIYADDNSLRAALDELLDSPSRREALGLCGNSAYHELYSPEVHLARYFEIIERLERERGDSPKRVESELEPTST